MPLSFEFPLLISHVNITAVISFAGVMCGCASGADVARVLMGDFQSLESPGSPHPKEHVNHPFVTC